jgi:hypothetical protein
MELELVPPQPDEVRRAVAELLVLGPRQADPWWEAGLEEALRDGLHPSDGLPSTGSG